MKIKLSSKITYISLLGFLILFTSLLFPSTAEAYSYQNYEWGMNIIPDECLGAQTDVSNPCGLNSFVQVFVNLAEVMYRVVPSLAMAMMIVGGFMFITAAGRPDAIQRGKKVILTVFVGMILVMGFAWAISFFTVISLTGEDIDGATGKIFPWQQDWWGSGEDGGPEYLPSTGCCILDGIGCKNVTDTVCADKGETYSGVTEQWMGNNQWCDQYPVACEQYTQQPGCCFPIDWMADPNNISCYVPNNDGCFDFPGTEYRNNSCGNISCDTIEGSPSGETGCCVEADGCSSTTFGECNSGTFLPGEACDDVDACNRTDGCCIARDGCTVEFNGCQGEYRDTDCGANAADCQAGCCVQGVNTNDTDVDNCTSFVTSWWCDQQADTQGIDPSLIPNCADLLTCANGCCESNCTEGRLDGSCTGTDMHWEPAACVTFPSCGTGCCRFDDGTNCTSNVYGFDCDTGGSDLWLGPGPCIGYAGCNEVCCDISTVANPLTCVDDVATDWCAAQSPPGTPYNLACDDASLAGTCF